MSFSVDEMAFLRTVPLDQAPPDTHLWVHIETRAWEFRTEAAYDFPPDSRGYVCVGTVDAARFWLDAHDSGMTSYFRPQAHSVFVTRRSAWPVRRKTVPASVAILPSAPASASVAA